MELSHTIQCNRMATTAAKLYRKFVRRCEKCFFLYTNHRENEKNDEDEEWWRKKIRLKE